MAKTFISSLIAQLDDTITTLADDGNSSAEFSGFIDTGSYSFNAALSGSIYGGMPDNKVLSLAGEEATGKTFFALGLVQRFLSDNEDGLVVYYDSEATITKELLSERGIDPKRVMIVEPDTIQTFRTHVLKLLEKYVAMDDRPRMMIVLDSLGQLSTNKEVEDQSSGADTKDMTRAPLIRGAFRTVRQKLAKANVPLILTNHIYAVIGAYVPTKEQSGGGGVKYASDAICFLSKKKDRDSEKEIVGNFIKVRMQKSRLSRENTDVETKLSYKNGLDRYHGLVQIAEDCGVFKKLAKGYQLPDGTKVFEKQLNGNPEKYFTKEVLDLIDVGCKKLFTYGNDGEAEVAEEEEEGEE